MRQLRTQIGFAHINTVSSNTDMEAVKGNFMNMSPTVLQEVTMKGAVWIKVKMKSYITASSLNSQQY